MITLVLTLTADDSPIFFKNSLHPMVKTPNFIPR